MLFSKSQPKIFCISFQRTGTTSVGRFFKEFGYQVASWDKERSALWSYYRFTGNIEAIFTSKDFKKHQVFEDNPWWELDFYRVLYHRFPNAKFILFTRDADKWFDSMLSHSKGKNLGNAFRHSKIYRREEEFYKSFPNENHYETAKIIDNRLPLNESHREHYKRIYTIRNKEIIEFFKVFSPHSLFVANLEDNDKWQRLGQFIGFQVPDNYSMHANKSN